MGLMRGMNFGSDLVESVATVVHGGRRELEA